MTHHDDLRHAADDLSRARQRVEQLLTERNAANDARTSIKWNSTTELRRDWFNSIALDEARREEEHAKRASTPSPRDLFAETFADALRASRSTSFPDDT
ncbi:hypothetical protein [Nocardioides houyundeii]|uniref:hypothetical protein n=1 Tax=Nocardioides houyundeii TaxID=2045452 RepID=UPI000C794EB4|nr:hypothetical protein [Nocardioides houyundeii]